MSRKHCQTCDCFDPDDATPPQPATSSMWARKQAKDALAAALRDIKTKDGRA